MPEEPSEIAQHIYENRQEMGKHLNELEVKVQQVTGLRAWLSKKPGLITGIGVAAAAILIRIVASRIRN